jgi:hypothetical protein
MHLKHSFMQSLKFIEIPDSQYAITYVDGIIMVPPKEMTSDGKLIQPEPYLDVLPLSRGTRGGARSHDAIYVGDVKLSNFRQLLNESGLRVCSSVLVLLLYLLLLFLFSEYISMLSHSQAEFNKGGVLVVNGTIALWRDTESESNNINIGMSARFFLLLFLLSLLNLFRF